MTAIIVFCSLCTLHYFGTLLRTRFRLLQKLYLPGSVVGGLWTALAFTLVFNFGWFKIWLISLAMLVFWGVVAWFYVRQNRREISHCVRRRVRSRGWTCTT